MPDIEDITVLPPSFEEWRSREPDKEIAVMMSGGVDSTLSALLLKEEGWRVLGITMQLPTAEGCEVEKACCGGEAAFAARDIGVTHYFIDARRVFQKFVIERFREQYFNGWTPNPCIDCNTFVKFHAVWNVVQQTFGVRFLATGHYGDIKWDNGDARLSRACDLERDQSYFIYGVPSDRLPFLRLPLGELQKSRVRDLAAEKGLDVASKRDSMELCFAGEGDYRKALNVDNDGVEGPITDTEGNVLGRHTGIWNYTVGQRRGLGIAAGEPLYVVGISPKENKIVVGTRQQTLRTNVAVRNANVLIPSQLAIGQKLQGKIRSYSDLSLCTIEDISSDGFRVQFENEIFAPTPGQHLVLYNQQAEVVAGGEITGKE